MRSSGNPSPSLSVVGDALERLLWVEGGQVGSSFNRGVRGEPDPQRPKIEVERSDRGRRRTLQSGAANFDQRMVSRKT